MPRAASFVLRAGSTAPPGPLAVWRVPSVELTLRGMNPARSFLSQRPDVATVGGGRRARRTLPIALVLLSTLAIAAPALASPGGNAGGNSAAAAACREGGYRDWTDVAGNAFRNEGACVSYAARGGTLVPVVVAPFSVVYSSLGPGVFRATVTGTGLEPSSAYQLSWVWPNRSVTLNATTGPSGGFVHNQDEQCQDSGGLNMTSFTATGTPAGGSAPTTYSLSTPPSSICP